MQNQCSCSCLCACMQNQCSCLCTCKIHLRSCFYVCKIEVAICVHAKSMQLYIAVAVCVHAKSMYAAVTCVHAKSGFMHVKLICNFYMHVCMYCIYEYIRVYVCTCTCTYVCERKQHNLEISTLPDIAKVHIKTLELRVCVLTNYIHNIIYMCKSHFLRYFLQQKTGN